MHSSSRQSDEAVVGVTRDRVIQKRTALNSVFDVGATCLQNWDGGVGIWMDPRMVLEAIA